MVSLNRFRPLKVALIAAFYLGIFVTDGSAAIDPALKPLLKPVVTQVSERTTATIKTFRETVPVTPPQVVQLYGETDPETGKSLFGMNPALARPTYPRPFGNKILHCWLVPAADDTIIGVEVDANGHEIEEGGFKVTIDKKFEKHGFLDWYEGPPGAKKNRTVIRGLMPDSITSFKTVTKRKGRRSLTRTHAIRGNSIILDLRTPTYIVIGGRKLKVDRGDSVGYFDGDFFK